MTYRKDTMEMDLGIYGKRRVSAHVRDGVAVARLSPKTWGVCHFLGGQEIYYKLQRSSLAAAKRVADKVLELPVDWTLSNENAEFKKSFAANVAAIRIIAEEKQA